MKQNHQSEKAARPGSENLRRLEIGAVYRDNEDGTLYVCADDQPDMQGDVLVINFDGSHVFALFEYPDTDETIASSLAEYFQNTNQNT